MISTLLKISWINLRRDRAALLLSFILPLIFFSIFASIFGGMGASTSATGGKTIKVLVVDEDATRLSGKLIDALAGSSDLELIRHPKTTTNNRATEYTRKTAWLAVRKGNAPIAIVVKKGFATHYQALNATDETIELLYDPSNIMALPAVSGLLQAASFKVAPDVLMEKGFTVLSDEGAPMTAMQRKKLDVLKPFLSGEKPWSERPGRNADTTTNNDQSQPGKKNNNLGFSMIKVKNTDVHQQPSTTSAVQHSSIIAYYAAAISVMFLLFSMTGAAGSLLDEQDSGTLERILTTKTTMTQLLLGKWLFYTLFGWAQLMLMFIWANIAFGLQLWTPFYFFGSLVVAFFTAAAAAAFGLLLATLCKTRSQLSGLSTIIILIMSAVGGSMVPRMFMPEFMQQLGKFTFNGQALDALLKIFWQFDPQLSGWLNFAHVIPQLLILSAMAVLLFLFARRLSRRWETQ